MSMTELSAMNTLELNRPFADIEMQSAVDMSIKALEEIQQYRAIGTVSEFRELKEKATERYSEEDAPDGYGHTCTNKTCAERIRAKAIGEFSERLKEKYPYFVEDVGFVEGNKMLHNKIDEIAKELKGE